MKTLVNKFIDQDLSRREFATTMLAMGFSASAAEAAISSAAYAASEPPIEGVEFTGNGGDIVAECLRAAGVEYVFDANSTGQAPFYDALAVRPDIKPIIALQEGQATAMAHGYELASGKTGVLFLGNIGMPNALSNLYNAWKDRSALAVFSDGRDTAVAGRDGFQQVEDWLGPTEEFTKWHWQINHSNRIAEMIRRVIKVAGTAPGGPVYLRIPSNLLSEKEVTQTIYPQSAFDVSVEMQPRGDLIEKAAKLLVEAKNPFFNVGGEVTRAGAQADLLELAELLGASVSQGYSVFGDFPYNNPQFAGFYAMGFPQGIRQSDVFLNLGTHMPDETIITGPPPKTTKVINARVEYEKIANRYPTDVGARWRYEGNHPCPDR